MNRALPLLLLCVTACRSTPPPVASSIDVTAPSASVAPIQSVAPASSSAPASSPASITLVEKGPQVLEWDFDVKGLPAIEDQTKTVVIADLSHGHIASSLSLTLRWLRSGKTDAVRTVPLLEPSEASRVLYDLDGPVAEAETKKLLERVRTRTMQANGVLSKTTLRSMKECRPEKYQGACTHPQRVDCDGQEVVLEGDELSYDGTKTGLGWGVGPMPIGNGPKVMLTCIQAAYFDRATRSFAAQIEHACEGGGSDACFLQSQWRVATLR